MIRRIEDVETLVELAQEEADADSLSEAQSEIGSIAQELDDMEIQTLLDGEYDERSAVVTIRSGAGGVDAADFAQMLLRMYLRYCERNGFKAKVMDTSYAEEAGIKSATFQVDAPYAYGRLSVEGGTHRLVRISPFDNQGRRQTSFAAVEVVPLVEATDPIDIPDTDCWCCATRRKRRRRRSSRATSRPAGVTRCVRTCFTRTRWSRICAPVARPARPRPCSTAISMRSSKPVSAGVTSSVARRPKRKSKP